jgi:hypothetical protein
MDHEPGSDPFGGEYGAVTAPGGFHVLSLLCFLAALGARFITPLFPDDLRRMLSRPILTALLVLGFSALGVLLGLIALRRPETRGTARIALGLNLIVLLLSGVAVWFVFRIMPD